MIPLAPEVIYVTHDRRFGITLPHPNKAEATREKRRDPRWIDLIEYVPRPTHPLPRKDKHG